MSKVQNQGREVAVIMGWWIAPLIIGVIQNFKFRCYVLKKSCFIPRFFDRIPI